MNKRRSSVGRRCTTCKIHQTLCFCDEINSLETLSRVSIIMHHRERFLTSNTANLATLVLNNCKIVLRGLPGKLFDANELGLNENETPLYLFPHEDAVELNEDFLSTLTKPVHLIIPDGTWSQAVKVYRRESALSHIQCVKLPLGEPGNYRLRKSERENGVCTYEAIMRALCLIEDKKLEIVMSRIFDLMVERTIKGRTAFEN